MLRAVGSGILGLSLLLNVIGVATKGWIVQPFGGFGIFSTHEVNAVVAGVFNILGDLALVAAIILAVLAHTQKWEGTQGRAGGIVGIVAGVLILVGVGNFTRVYIPIVGHSPWVTFGYSFALCWTSFVLALIGGGLALKNDG